MRGLRLWRVLHGKPFVKPRHQSVCYEVPKRPYEPEDDLSRVGTSLRERYVRGELQIWVWCKLRGVVHNDGYYLAVFDRFSREFHRDGSSIAVIVGTPHVNGGCRDYELPVLVKDVQGVDRPNALGIGSSVVRLYRLDQCECSWWNLSTDSEPASPFRIRELFDEALLRRPLASRKLRSVIGSFPIDKNQLPSEVIERTSEGMNDLSDLSSPIDAHLRGIDCLIDMRTALVVNFWCEGIEITVNQSIEVAFESTHLDFRSLDLDADSVIRGSPHQTIRACDHV